MTPNSVTRAPTFIQHVARAFDTCETHREREHMQLTHDIATHMHTKKGRREWRLCRSSNRTDSSGLKEKVCVGNAQKQERGKKTEKSKERKYV